MRRVLITGGSRGIGAATVAAFTMAGERVAFFYRENEKAALETAARTGAFAVRCDVSDPDSVRAAYAQVNELLSGAPQVLVNNAGIADIRLSRDLGDKEWRRIVDTDLSAAFYLCRACQVDMIREQYGRIVNIGSMWGKRGASCEVAYSAAKAGVRGLTMALAKELGPSGITVNCVEPGVIDTEMNAELSPAIRDELREQTPLCRIGTPEDVAAAVLFLCSDQAAFITGQMLGVDGGYAV